MRDRTDDIDAASSGIGTLPVSFTPAPAAALSNWWDTPSSFLPDRVMGVSDASDGTWYHPDNSNYYQAATKLGLNANDPAFNWADPKAVKALYSDPGQAVRYGFDASNIPGNRIAGVRRDDQNKRFVHYDVNGNQVGGQGYKDDSSFFGGLRETWQDAYPGLGFLAATALGANAIGGSLAATSAVAGSTLPETIALMEANGMTAAEISAATGGTASGFTAADIAAMGAGADAGIGALPGGELMGSGAGAGAGAAEPGFGVDWSQFGNADALGELTTGFPSLAEAGAGAITPGQIAAAGLGAGAGIGALPGGELAAHNEIFNPYGDNTQFAQMTDTPNFNLENAAARSATESGIGSLDPNIGVDWSQLGNVDALGELTAGGAGLPSLAEIGAGAITPGQIAAAALVPAASLGSLTSSGAYNAALDSQAANQALNLGPVTDVVNPAQYLPEPYTSQSTTFNPAKDSQLANEALKLGPVTDAVNPALPSNGPTGVPPGSTLPNANNATTPSSTVPAPSTPAPSTLTPLQQLAQTLGVPAGLLSGLGGLLSGLLQGQNNRNNDARAAINTTTPISPMTATRTSQATPSGGHVFQTKYHAAGGGITGLPNGGNQGLLRGAGDGLSDSIATRMPDGGPAQLGDGEYIWPADATAALGNGSTDAGARRLDEMVAKVRKMAHGTTKQMHRVDPGKVMS